MNVVFNPTHDERITIDTASNPAQITVDVLPEIPIRQEWLTVLGRKNHVNVNARKRVSHDRIVTLCVEDATPSGVGDFCPPSTGVTTPVLGWRNGSAVAEGYFRFRIEGRDPLRGRNFREPS